MSKIGDLVKVVNSIKQSIVNKVKNLDKVKQNILDRAKKEKWTISDYENYMRNIEKRIKIYTQFVKDKDRNDILVDFLLKRTVELTEIFNFLKKN